MWVGVRGVLGWGESGTVSVRTQGGWWPNRQDSCAWKGITLSIFTVEWRPTPGRDWGGLVQYSHLAFRERVLSVSCHLWAGLIASLSALPLLQPSQTALHPPHLAVFFLIHTCISQSGMFFYTLFVICLTPIQIPCLCSKNIY